MANLMKNVLLLRKPLLLRTSVRQSSQSQELVLSSTKNNVTTITMNNPKKYNAWDMALTEQLADKFSKAATDSHTKVVIYTATDPYFCSGGSLAEFLGRKSPKGLQKMIRENNQKCFNIFIEFPKPLIAAVNGPGIGSGTTAPALCDTIIASEKATFLTPFRNLGVGPEGCASVHFERILGPDSASRLLVDCWRPTAWEALEIGLVAEVVTHDKLLVRAQELGEEWIRSGRERSIRGGGNVEEYKQINAKESNDLAEAFVSAEFLSTQLQFLKKKGKHRSLAGFILWAMLVSRPVWVKTL
eukprot:GFUD01139560.1.p1 GENE.GFUD01139560.1~~GFUD01139560.1.p1  ORF type:complete len:300 (+),score=84.96 GFUD01139560.1:150-1049(+)